MNQQLTIFGVSLLALSTSALGQTGTQPRPAPSPAPTVGQESVRVHALADVLGLEIKTQDNKDLGEVEDLILDSVDGSIDYVVIGQGGVLGVGEDKYLVPFESVRFAHGDVTRNDDMKVKTSLTEERIRKAPKLGKDLRIGPDVERSIREAAGLTPEPMQPRAQNSELVCAKRVKGTKVLGATQEKIGELDDMVVDPHGGMVAYNVLATGGTLGLGEKRYALPWEVTRVRLDADNKVAIGSDLTKEQLAKAPEFDSKDTKRMLSVPYLKEIYLYYSVEPYFMRTPPTSTPRTSVREGKGESGN